MSLLRVTRLLRPITNYAVPMRRLMTPASVPADGEYAGTQSRDHDLALQGVGGFNDTPATGAFGTIAAPVKIYSSFHSRIVGCKGGDNSRHRLLWFELKEGKKHVCTECGQVFQLLTPPRP